MIPSLFAFSIVMIAIRVALYGQRLRPFFDCFTFFFLFFILIPIGNIYVLSDNPVLPARLYLYRDTIFPALVPAVFSTIAYSLFFSFYIVFNKPHGVRAFNSENYSRQQRVGQIDDKQLLTFYVLAALTVLYLLAGLIVERTFPLFVLLQDHSFSRLRDMAFNYASDTNTLFIFSPQVYGVAYRVILPFCALALMARGRKKHGWIFMAIAIVFCAGSLKRMQLIYVLLSLVIFLSIRNFSGRINRRMFTYGILMIAFAAGMTYLYSGDKFGHFLFERVFVIEAISEYAAYSSYFRFFDPLYFDLFFEKLLKIFNREVITFSQRWKEFIAIHDARGFSSVGIFCELFISFWYYGLILVPVLSLCFALMDRAVYRCRDLEFWCLSAVICGAMAMKGLNSQLFSGGLLPLIVVHFTLRFLRVGVRPKGMGRAAAMVPRSGFKATALDDT